jgi:hypothetical protein
VGIYTFFVVQVVIFFFVQKQESQSQHNFPCQERNNLEIESIPREKKEKDHEAIIPVIAKTEEAASSPPPEVNSFVCINGQLERLELENKIETVLNPILEDIGGTMDIALVVTSNKAIFTKDDLQKANHQPAFTKYQDAVDYLTSRGFNVVTSEVMNHAENPAVYREYLQHLAQVAGDKKLKDPAFFAYDKRRAQNHVRQAVSGELCYRHMIATGKDYSHGIVTRWRDDVGFERRLKIKLFHKWLHDPPAVDEALDLAVVKPGQWRPTLVTPFCRNWQGLNDRGGFVHPKGAYIYFMASIAAFTAAVPLPRDYVCNHERFLRHIYNQEGFMFIPTRLLYPIPMYIDNGKGVFREGEKNNQLCRVWWNSYRPDCPHQDGPPIELLDSTTGKKIEDSALAVMPVIVDKPRVLKTEESSLDIVSFVCITGQLERLELENKIKTLLDPIREDIGGTVDVALVITNNTALYTKKNVANEMASHSPIFKQYQEAVDYLTSRDFNVVTTGAATHTKDPLVYPEYQQRLAQLANDKKIKKPEHFAYNYKRAQNHIRQAISCEVCYRHMIATETDYSRGIVTRWRDDVGFENRLPIKDFYEWLYHPPHVKEKDDLGKRKIWRPTMVTPHCRNWQGLNDRGAFVHPKGAYAYFMAPIAAFIRNQELPPARVCNYERFLRFLYNEEGFTYIPTKLLYPVPMFNDNGTGVFRQEELKRLCGAFWNSYTENCQRYNETITILTS